MSLKTGVVQQLKTTWNPPDFPEDGKLTHEWYSRLTESLKQVHSNIQAQTYQAVNNVTKPVQSSVGTVAVPQVLWCSTTSGGPVTQKIQLSNGVVVALAPAYTPPPGANATPLQIPVANNAPAGKVSKAPP